MDRLPLFDKEFLNELGDDIVYEFQMAVKTMREQVTNTTPASSYYSSYDQSTHVFTTHFYTQANALGLTEQDAIEVYEQGEEVKEGRMQKDYGDREIGIEFARDQFSGKPIITAIYVILHK